MEQDKSAKSRSQTSLVLGVILVILGVLFFVAQLFEFSLGTYLGQSGWPLFIIIPGVALFILALFLEPNAGTPLVSVASVISSSGLLMFYQNSANHWESWAYAWSLVFPASTGAGLFLYGLFRGQSNLRRSGLNMVVAGSILFTIGFIFFEGLIGLSGFRFGVGNLCWPVLLIGLGLLLLLRNFKSWPG